MLEISSRDPRPISLHVEKTQNVYSLALALAKFSTVPQFPQFKKPSSLLAKLTVSVLRVKFLYIYLYMASLLTSGSSINYWKLITGKGTLLA